MTKGDQIREEIVDAATTIFDTRGYEGSLNGLMGAITGPAVAKNSDGLNLSWKLMVTLGATKFFSFMAEADVVQPK